MFPEHILTNFLNVAAFYAPLDTVQVVEFEPTHAFHTPGEPGWAIQVERAGS